MNVGDYVRVNTKTMNKYVGITRLESETDYAWYFKDLTILKRPDRRSKKVVDINDFNYKSSPNIIDLIEVGDYVNGYKVTDIYTHPKNKKICIKIERMDYDGRSFIDFEDIKSIVTCEQFEEMEYKI